MNTFESSVSAALGQPRAGKLYLAAVSGGADSTAMLAALAALRKEAGFVLHCVHVEHGIRPAEESRGDAKAVEELCEKLDVSCRVISVPAGRIAAFASNGGPGIEGAARIFRRRAWNREMRRLKADRILTAHTRDDLLETLLMRILRGSGPAGLAPMPQNIGRITRPLLDLTRRDVLKYLEEKGLPYRTDSTNMDIRFLRNRVRHKLIPFLNEFFPSWQTSLLTLAETQALTAEFLADEVRKRLSWKNGEAGELVLREEDFLKSPPILREEAVFAGADMLAAAQSKGKGLKPVTEEHACVQTPRRSALRRAMKQINAGQLTAAHDLGPVRLERQNGFITMTDASLSRFEKGFSLLIKEPGFYTLKGGVLGTEKDLYIRAEVSEPMEPSYESRPEADVFSAGFSAGCPLVFRNHREGDRICRGGHKRRFRDILDRNTRAELDVIISACDAEGTAAFISIDRHGEFTVSGRDATARVSEAGPKFKIMLDKIGGC